MFFLAFNFIPSLSLASHTRTHEQNVIYCIIRFSFFFGSDIIYCLLSLQQMGPTLVTSIILDFLNTPSWNWNETLISSSYFFLFDKFLYNISLFQCYLKMISNFINIYSNRNSSEKWSIFHNTLCCWCEVNRGDI